MFAYFMNYKRHFPINQYKLSMFLFVFVTLFFFHSMCCRGREEETLLFNKNKRRCTDLLFFLLFLVAIAGSIWCIYDAKNAGGNPERIINGIDYQGNYCGKTVGFEDKPFAAWPILPLTQTLDAAAYYRIKVCVASCDETNTNTALFKDLYESRPVFKYCFPIATSTINRVTGLFSDASDNFSWMLADILKTWPVIAVAVGASAFIAFFYILLMRCKCVRACMVWLSILGLIAGAVVAGLALLQYAKNQDALNIVGMENRTLAARICGWVLIGLAALFFLIVLFLRKKIVVALEIMGASSQVLSQICSLLIYPVFPTAIAAGFGVYWIYGALMLFSVKDEMSTAIPTLYNSIPEFSGVTFTTTYEWNVKYQYLFIYFTFFLFWCIKFIVYSSLMTMAGAVGNWYYSYPTANPAVKKVGSDEYELSRWPVLASAWRIIRYHIGTVAFASFILAVIMMIRAVVMYIQRRTRAQQNAVTRCLFRVVNCCLSCCQSCLNILSRNALIWCALRGDSFCSSAFNAFGCLTRDLRLTIALTAVGGFIIFIGKFIVALITTGAAGFAIWGIYEKDEINSNIIPLVLIFILSFIIASFFLEVYDSVVDTVFICFIADGEKKFASQKLTTAANKLREEANKIAPEEVNNNNNQKNNRGGSNNNGGGYNAGYNNSYAAAQPSNYSNNRPASNAAGVSYV